MWMIGVCYSVDCTLSNINRLLLYPIFDCMCVGCPYGQTGKQHDFMMKNCFEGCTTTHISISFTSITLFSHLVSKMAYTKTNVLLCTLQNNFSALRFPLKRMLISGLYLLNSFWSSTLPVKLSFS